MWNILKEAKEIFLKYNLLPIHESDHDWEIALREAKEEDEDLISRLKEELEEVKGELLHVLPRRFIPYITFNNFGLFFIDDEVSTFLVGTTTHTATVL